MMNEQNAISIVPNSMTYLHNVRLKSKVTNIALICQ